MNQGERETMTWGDLGEGSPRSSRELVHRDGYEPDIILAIARGGLLVAGALSYALDVKNTFTMNVEFYTGIDERLDMPMILPPVPEPHRLPRDTRVLIADDVADTGADPRPRQGLPRGQGRRGPVCRPLREAEDDRRLRVRLAPHGISGSTSRGALHRPITAAAGDVVPVEQVEDEGWWRRPEAAQRRSDARTVGSSRWRILAVFFITLAGLDGTTGSPHWTKVGVGSGITSFEDMAAITSGWDCTRAPHRALPVNPCDPLGRPYDYPRWVSKLTFLGLGGGDKVALGFLTAVLFYVSALLVAGPLTVGKECSTPRCCYPRRFCSESTSEAPATAAR